MPWTFHSYFILVFLISVAEMKFCPNEIPKAEDDRFGGDFNAEDDKLGLDSGSKAAKKCFDEKAGHVFCQVEACSGDKVCRTGDIEGDIACLINACQMECGSSKRDSALECVKECLSVDKCIATANAAFFVNCVRNIRGIGFFEAYKYWIIGIVVICLAICSIVGCIACCVSLSAEVFPRTATDDKAAYEAALRADPYRPATETTVYNPNFHVQMPPKMVPQGVQNTNPSFMSAGPTTAKTTTNPEISAA